jgi:hypothetical protein
MANADDQHADDDRPMAPAPRPRLWRKAATAAAGADVAVPAAPPWWRRTWGRVRAAAGWAGGRVASLVRPVGGRWRGGGRG